MEFGFKKTRTAGSGHHVVAEVTVNQERRIKRLEQMVEESEEEEVEEDDRERR